MSLIDWSRSPSNRTLIIRIKLKYFQISSDIKTVLLIHLSQKATDGRLDWSGLKLENVTPQVRIGGFWTSFLLQNINFLFLRSHSWI